MKNEKGVLRNFAKFIGKHLCRSLFFNKGLSLQLYLKKRLWLRCFLKKTPGRLLLKVSQEQGSVRAVAYITF